MRRILMFFICVNSNFIFAQRIEYINEIDSLNRVVYEEVDLALKGYSLMDYFNESDTLRIFFSEAYTGGANFHVDYSLQIHDSLASYTPIDFMELPYPKNKDQIFIRLKIYCKMNKGQVSIDGFVYQQKLHVNLKDFCLYRSFDKVEYDLKLEEFKMVDSLFRTDLNLKQIDSIFMLNYLVYKYPSKYCYRLSKDKEYSFRISKEILPKYEVTMNLTSQQQFASNTVIVSNTKYLELDHCNSSNYDVVFYVQDESYFDGRSKNKFIRNNYNYVNNEYFIISLDYKIIRHGVFSFDNLENYRQKMYKKRMFFKGLKEIK